MQSTWPHERWWQSSAAPQSVARKEQLNTDIVAGGHRAATATVLCTEAELERCRKLPAAQAAGAGAPVRRRAPARAASAGADGGAGRCARRPGCRRRGRGAVPVGARGACRAPAGGNLSRRRALSATPRPSSRSAGCSAAYRLTRYRGSVNETRGAGALIAAEGADLRYAQAAAQARELARDLINRRRMNSGPSELALAAQGAVRALRRALSHRRRR